NYYSKQFIFNVLIEFYGVFFNPFYAYKNISRNQIVFTIVKCDDIRECIVLKVFLVNFMEIVVRTANKSYFSEFFSFIGNSSFNNRFNVIFILNGIRNIFCVESYSSQGMLI